MAASCSSDIQMSEIAGADNQGNSGFSAPITKTIDNILLPLSNDADFQEAVELYSQFTYQLLARDINSVILPQLKNVVDSTAFNEEEGRIVLNMNKISGQYDAAYNSWTYSPAKDSIKFNFRSFNDEDCSLNIFPASSKTNDFTPFVGLDIDVKIPTIYKDELISDGKVLSSGSIKTGINDDIASIDIERNCGAYQLNFSAFESKDIAGILYNNFSIKEKESDKNIVSAVYQTALGNDYKQVYSTVTFGDEADSEYLSLGLESNNLPEFFYLLAANGELRNPFISDFEAAAIKNRVVDFNLAGPIEFTWANADTTLNGILKLAYREADKYFCYDRICFNLTYEFEGSEQTVEIEAPAEEAVLSVIRMIEDFQAETIAACKAYIEFRIERCKDFVEGVEAFIDCKIKSYEAFVDTIHARRIAYIENKIARREAYIENKIARREAYIEFKIAQKKAFVEGVEAFIDSMITSYQNYIEFRIECRQNYIESKIEHYKAYVEFKKARRDAYINAKIQCYKSIVDRIENFIRIIELRAIYAARFANGIYTINVNFFDNLFDHLGSYWAGLDNYIDGFFEGIIEYYKEFYEEHPIR